MNDAQPARWPKLLVVLDTVAGEMSVIELRRPRLPYSRRCSWAPVDPSSNDPDRNSRCAAP